MGIISSILGYVGMFSMSVISFLGYPGVFIMMALESMIFPIPSELVMPFAGFLIAQGKLNFPLVIIFSTFGSLFGSLLSYYIGKYTGDQLVIKYGKYFFLNKSDLEKTHNWFMREGGKTIFISRLVPVVRHLISIPAGIGKMNIKKFCFYTITGATIWNTFLAYLGFIIGENWKIISKYSEYISVPVFIIMLILGIYFVYRHIKK